MRITSISYRTGKLVSCFAYVATIRISACTIYREYLNINETVIWFWIVSSECAKHLRLTLSSLAGLTSPTEGSRWVRSACERGRKGNPSLVCLASEAETEFAVETPASKRSKQITVISSLNNGYFVRYFFLFQFLSCSVFQLVCPVSSKGVLHAKRDLLKVNGNVS